MAISEPIEGIHLVDLDQQLTGFRRFIGSWVVRRGGDAVVVDPGPRSSLPVLLRALEELSVERVDRILLTHIHIDHAGGAGLLAAGHPEARVVCHPEGIRHLIDPAKLWAGSLKVLGAVAEAYGEIAPVPAGQIAYEEAFEVGGVRFRAVETPGHAAHHLCYLTDDVLFAGEVAGVRYPVEEGFYLRLATPPVFVHEVFRASLARARALGASTLCFGHYGVSREPERVFDAAAGQLDRWLAALRARPALSPGWEEEVFAELAATDPCLAAYERLPPDVRQREKYFCLNSFRGMRAYLEGGRA